MERGPPARIVSACLGTEEEPCVRMAAHAPIIDDSNKVVTVRATCDSSIPMARPNSDLSV